MSLYRKDLGASGEKIAGNYLVVNKFQILKKNFRSKFGEVDIIAKKNNCIYFIEIKTRSNDRYGKPYEAVTNQKISHLQKAADYFLLKNPSKDLKLKLAVVSIQLDINEIKFFEI
ncbi:MAG: hypothetical protein UR68_C0004G0028 [Candidatus Roizmanbacteria bacterium GW2011_GWA2_35_19]|uniref:UPF0102 protein UR68_C0004G0028 n=2 Tax=Candidatus Roizmaniibacteriota TaxID=1752723 RepID=A0A0G0EDY8_9BACT|nr:MAG: hypothetical protein UR63_C0002G0014 [Candidatus Roizmanbacteria bacterium GW2011_GWC2_35_12]KKP73475.1 MAG: hypothetical protein UR68_C0004G0028 [Candidatus Roizmanbacteria bacterium GW2011_GWA2_35_19]